jgi:hypothetical protein
MAVPKKETSMNDEGKKKAGMPSLNVMGLL